MWAEVLTCFFHTTAPPAICLGCLTHMKCLTVVFSYLLAESHLWLPPGFQQCLTWLFNFNCWSVFFPLQTISSATLSGSCQRHPKQPLPHHSPHSAVRLHHSYPWRWGWGGIQGIKHLAYRIFLSYTDICAKRSLCEIRKKIQEYVLCIIIYIDWHSVSYKAFFCMESDHKLALFWQRNMLCSMRHFSYCT